MNTVCNKKEAQLGCVQFIIGERKNTLLQN